MYRRAPKKSRRGAILVLAAFLMIVMLGMVAFAVDVGYMMVARAELQNAADFAALAGGGRLLDRDLLAGNANVNAQVAAAVAEAQTFAALNKAGAVPIELAPNPGNSLDGDVVVGYLSNPSDLTSVMSHATTPYNAITVTARRSAQQNSPLGLFFGSIFGTNQVEVAASATAVFEGKVTGFHITGANPGVQNSKLLPFAMHVDVWNAVTNGQGPDEWSYDPLTKAVTAGGDGIKEAKLYGAKTHAPGNFGTVNIGAPNNSTNDVVRQILYGPNYEDFQYLGGKLELGPDGTTTLIGDPGLSAGFKAALTAIIGQPRIVPLYTELTGNGANSEFTIVGFAGVILTSVRLTGPDKAVTIQPEFVVDATAISGDGGSLNGFIYRPLRLAR